MAGVDGAGVDGASIGGTGGGMLSAYARAQYVALGNLRLQMLKNGLRSNRGAVELGARALSFLLYAGLGLALGAGAASAAYGLASREMWIYLPIVFWVLLLIWQVVPVMLASFQDQFDLGSLLRFPVSFGSFYLLYVVYGLADISSILGGLCCLGIWVGITMARHDLSSWAALGLVVFAVFNVLLVRAVFAWIDRWLAQRKTREILGAVFVMMMLSLQFLNPAMHARRHRGHTSPEQQAQDFRATEAQYAPWLRTADAVQKWLPPGLAANSLRLNAERQPAPALGSLGLLGLYALAAGAVLAGRLRAEYRGESLSQAPSRKKAAERRESGWLLDGSGPMAAVMEKELRGLLRTLPLLYSIGAPLLLVLIFSGAFVNSSPQGHMFLLALPLCTMYPLLGFTRVFYNNLGTEGAGIQIYFLSPTPIRTVMLAKNLFHSALFAFSIGIAVILFMLRVGRPEGVVVAATLAWLLFVLPCNLAVGNIFSLTMPYRVNPGRMTRQGGSQANALASLLAQALVLGVGASVFLLCSFLGQLWMAIPIFLVLAAGASLAWMRVLGNMDVMASQRKEALMATLMKTE
jgi:ABC-2 type transport system permease protein